MQSYQHASTGLGEATSAEPPTPRRRGLSFRPQVAFALDAAMMTIVAAVAVLLRQTFHFFELSLDVRDNFYVAGPVLLVGWLAVVALMGGYRERVFESGAEEYKVVLNATVVAAGLIAAAAYLLKYQLSRSFFLMVFGLGTVMLVLGRVMLRKAVHKARRAGSLRHDVVVAGTPANVDGIAHVLARESWLGYRIKGAVVPPSLLAEETPRGIPILGTTDNVLDVVVNAEVDVIFIAGGALDGPDQMRELVWELEQHKVRLVVAPSVTDVARERIRIRPAGGLPLVHIDPPRHVQASRRAKRAFDVLTTLGILTLAAPTMIAVAAWIKLNDRGPVFFRQTRTGRNGQEFSCLKFRTMVVDAEARLEALKKEQGFTSGLFKMKDDPRITRPGRLLRRLSLDELPQLLNVLRGDMSLVGPRPPLPTEVETYDRFTRRRLHVRPGLTGLWQVSGRSDLTWDESIRLDLYYVDNWSMLQDLTILSRTLGAVLASRGAY